uniref:Uncharacterized protein n=1 Tax=Oryza meridionalis TaxID=40149 RepID=A0A0E0EVH9_9ORYZ
MQELRAQDNEMMESNTTGIFILELAGSSVRYEPEQRSIPFNKKVDNAIDQGIIRQAFDFNTCKFTRQHNNVQNSGICFCKAWLIHLLISSEFRGRGTFDSGQSGTVRQRLRHRRDSTHVRTAWRVVRKVMMWRTMSSGSALNQSLPSACAGAMAVSP